MPPRGLPPRPGFDKKSPQRTGGSSFASSFGSSFGAKSSNTKPPNLLNSGTAVSEGLKRFGTPSSQTSQQASDLWKRAGEQQRNYGAGQQRFGSQGYDSSTGVGSCMSKFSKGASSVASYFDRFGSKEEPRDLAPLIRKLNEREDRLAKSVGKTKRRSIDDGEDPALEASKDGEDMGPDGEQDIGNVYDRSVPAIGAQPLQPLRVRLDGWPKPPTFDKPDIQLLHDYLSRSEPISNDNGVDKVYETSRDDGGELPIPSGATYTRDGWLCLGRPPLPPAPATGTWTIAHNKAYAEQMPKPSSGHFEWRQNGQLVCQYAPQGFAIEGPATIFPEDNGLPAALPFKNEEQGPRNAYAPYTSYGYGHSLGSAIDRGRKAEENAKDRELRQRDESKGGRDATTNEAFLHWTALSYHEKPVNMQRLNNPPEALVQALISGKLEFSREQFDSFGDIEVPPTMPEDWFERFKSKISRGTYIERDGVYFKPFGKLRNFHETNQTQPMSRYGAMALLGDPVDESLRLREKDHARKEFERDTMFPPHEDSVQSVVKEFKLEHAPSKAVEKVVKGYMYETMLAPREAVKDLKKEKQKYEEEKRDVKAPKAKEEGTKVYPPNQKDGGRWEGQHPYTVIDENGKEHATVPTNEAPYGRLVSDDGERGLVPAEHGDPPKRELTKWWYHRGEKVDYRGRPGWKEASIDTGRPRWTTGEIVDYRGLTAARPESPPPRIRELIGVGVRD